MATVRAGKKGALVVVDVQVGVVQDAHEAAQTVGRVARAVERARQAGLPVVWVQHQSDDELVHGSAAWQWVPELVPAAGEARIDKRYNSAFEDTPLEQQLAAAGISHIVLAGAATNWCIRATAYGALDRGYDLSLLKDAHTTGTLTLDDGSTVEADSVKRDLNIAMTWLRYPGRSNQAVAVDEMDFAALR